nr:choice-of-anchor Q domain-containing protein [Candidatus Sumerlaeota bacterium]
IRSCIVWGNNAPQSPGAHNSKHFSYCDLQELDGRGSHNISADPLFENVLNGDFHLSPLSPCIDAGGRFPDVTIDFEGDPRPFDAIPERSGDGYNYDIGADEFIGK